jgi:adenylate cyclase
MSARRKLAAILSADVAGYSRLMAADEAGTLHDLNQARAVFSAAVQAHHGRVVDTAGDSVLAEFDSPVPGRSLRRQGPAGTRPARHRRAE